jgi:acyl-CoA thioester hydrolase
VTAAVATGGEAARPRSQAPGPGEPRLTDRGTFTVWTYDKLRFNDTDRIGHVNNAVFATLLETGRVELLYDRERPMAPPGTDFVIVRLELDFRAEMHYPGRIDIGTCVLSVGRASFTLGQGLFQGDMCVATGRSVLALLSHETRRSTVLPDEMRERLMAIQAG